MARKKEADDTFFVLLVFIIGVLSLLPFIWFIYKHHKKLKDQYNVENTHTIHDRRNVYSSIFLSFGLIFCVFLALFFVLQSQTQSYALESRKVSTLGVYTILSISFPIIIFILWKISLSIACTLLGVIVNYERKELIIPIDIANSGDLLSPHGFMDLGKVEVVKLGDITKVTKEKGVTLFIHGAFGSRAISFSAKQKRDECIATLENVIKTKTRDYGY